MLPAYLSVLVAGDRTRPDGPRATATALGRALRCTAALTTGYVLVFGAFGLVLAPLSGWLSPRLPWFTVGFGLVLAVLGGRLLAGRPLPATGRVRAPRLRGTTASMVLFGMAYALASLGCAAGPFLAIVGSSLRAGSVGAGLTLFLAYALGMGLLIGVVAAVVALARVSALVRLRRAAGWGPRLGGAVLLAAGAYVAYYGRYALRLAGDRRIAGSDPVVGAATAVQHRLGALVADVGAGRLVLVLAVVVAVAWLFRRRPATPPGVAAPLAHPDRRP